MQAYKNNNKFWGEKDDILDAYFTVFLYNDVIIDCGYMEMQ